MSSEFLSQPLAPASGLELQQDEVPEEDMDPPESMSIATEYNQSEVLAYLINEVYRPRIEQDVNFRLLMSSMPFMSKIMPAVYIMEKAGNKTEAARVFFTHLKEVEEQGKYQSFVEALRRAKYPFLVKILENKEVVVHHDNEHKELINIFLNDIAEKIDPDVLSNELQSKDVITSAEGEQIRATSRSSSMRDASFELLLALPRRISNWYEIFLGVLLEYNHNNLVRKIDPKFFAQRTGRSEEELSSIAEYQDLSLIAHVNTTPSGHNNEASFTASTVGTSQNNSSVNMPASIENSARFLAGELRELGDQHSATTSTVSANLSPLPDQRERTAISSSENKTLFSELADLKLMFQEQTKYMLEMLQRTDQVARRMDRLEQKLDNFIKVTSHKN